MHVSTDTLLAEASGLVAGAAGCCEPQVDARSQSQGLLEKQCVLLTAEHFCSLGNISFNLKEKQPET